MTSGGGAKSCVVCSSVEENGEGGVSGGGGACKLNFQSNKWFSQFCGELEMCRSYGGYHDNELFEAFQFLQDLEGSVGALFVCGECMGVITEAMERRGQMEIEELEVLKLQAQILARMEVLKECTSLYFKEMEKILERVRRAEVAIGEGTEKPKKMSVLHLLRFREKIIDVVTFMGMFREDLNHKLLHTTKMGTSQSQQSMEETFPQQELVEDSVNVNVNLLNTPASPLAPVDYDSDDRMSPANDHASSDQENFEDTSAPNDHPDETSIPVETTSTKDEPLSEAEEPDLQEESEDEYKPPKPKKRRRKRTPKAILNSELDDGSEPSLPKRRRRKGSSKAIPTPDLEGASESSQPKRRQKRNSKAVPKRCSDLKDNPESSRPASAWKWKPLDAKKLEIMNRALREIDFSRMSILRKKLIESIIRRQVQVSQLKSSKPEIADAPPQYDLTTLTAKDEWSYNSSTDQITLAGVQIDITDAKPNSLLVSCKSCDFQYSRGLTPTNTSALYKVHKDEISLVQYQAFNHVFRDHLKLFQCKLCSYQASSLKTFQYHQETHLNPQTYMCEVCGNSYTNKKSYYHHQQGCVNGPRFSCSICGKKFKVRKYMRDHEETHKPLEERPHVTCPLCGQRMLKKGYKTHKIDYCAARREGLHPIICPICGKKFSSAKYVNEHIERKHNSQNQEKVHKCNECGVGFKMVKDLISHQSIVHLKKDQKQPCGKGCGREFILPFYLQKHEAVCDGSKKKPRQEQSACLVGDQDN